MKAREAKAHSIVSEIRAILLMFVNGVLFNSEVWQAATATGIANLDKVDNNLLRAICNAHSKTPVEFIYLESGCIPLRFVMQSQQLMYLHHILGRDEKELIKRIYIAQKENTFRRRLC